MCVGNCVLFRGVLRSKPPPPALCCRPTAGRQPKHKFAERGKVKPKSIKSKAKLSSKRKLSRFGKEQRKGFSGEATTYITRTKAVKKLHITLRDFRWVWDACAVSVL